MKIVYEIYSNSKRAYVIQACKETLAGRAILYLRNDKAKTDLLDNSTNNPYTVLNTDLQHLVDRNNLAIIIQTSGSTGVPKKVALSLEALKSSISATENFFTQPGQWLCILPFSFMAGILTIMRSVNAGFDALIDNSNKNIAQKLLDLCVISSANNIYVSMVPAQLFDLVAIIKAKKDIRSYLTKKISAILLGGSGVDHSLLLQAKDLGLKIVTSYGSTETTGGCVYDGELLNNVQAKIIDDELYLSSPSLAFAYLNDDFSISSLSDDYFVDILNTKWYKTGDLAVFVNNKISITGRKDRVYISGGMNVAVADVASCINNNFGAIEGVEYVLVIMPDSKWGQRLWGVFVLEAALRIMGQDAHPTVKSNTNSFTGKSSTLQNLINTKLKHFLGNQTKLAECVIVSQLPFLPSGKVDMIQVEAMLK